MNGEELDKALILRMLLEHERRLRRIDGELRGRISYWLKLTEKLRRINQWSRELESMR